MFKNKQKAIIVFSMLGEVFSDSILRKLPNDVFEKVQEEVLPFVGQIPLPDDIDAFVLDNILKDEELLDIEEEEEFVAEIKEENILELDGDIFLAKAPLESVVFVLKQEKTIFQVFLITFFNEETQKLLKQLLMESGVNLIKDFQKTAILEGVEAKVKKEFIEKVKAHIKQETKV